MPREGPGSFLGPLRVTKRAATRSKPLPSPSPTGAFPPLSYPILSSPRSVLACVFERWQLQCVNQHVFVHWNLQRARVRHSR